MLQHFPCKSLFGNNRYFLMSEIITTIFRQVTEKEEEEKENEKEERDEREEQKM